MGKVKAFATAEALRNIADDTHIHVYANGINEKDVDSFAEGCDIISDAIDFMAISPRILLHRKARAASIPIINSYPIGFGVFLFHFSSDSPSIEEVLGLPYEETIGLAANESLNEESKKSFEQMLQAMLRGLAPHIPIYTSSDSPVGNASSILKRMREEHKGAVLGSTTVMASGFAATHIVLQLMQHSAVQRSIPDLPPMPGYLFFDAATMQSETVTAEQRLECQSLASA